LHELRNILRQAQNDGVSVGHSNVADLVLMKAVSAAAREVRVPVACATPREAANLLDRFCRTRSMRRPVVVLDQQRPRP
jgi:fructose/tagatose bisphosphate aldolase